jgi:hypothetical protein
MERIHEILLRKNMPHVATLQNKNGDFEELDYEKPLNLKELVQGLAELNKNGIVILDIRAGVSREGITKIADVSNAGLYKDGEWILEPKNYEDVNLPEVNPVPFKSDSWVLGEFIVQYKTGKGIPKRFIKSQVLLDKFVGEDDGEILRKLLVLDPSTRSYTWDLVSTVNNNDGGGGCSIM